MQNQPKTPINLCDILEFRRKGFVGTVLGWLLKLLVPKWDAWGWHTAFVWQPDIVGKGWWVFEATSQGMTTNYYHETELRERCRIWRWFPEVPILEVREKFFLETFGKRYDVAIYPWTALAIIIRHFFNRPIPKLLDNRFSCWEHVAEGCDEMGKSLVSKYDVIVISDLIENLKKRGMLISVPTRL